MKRYFEVIFLSIFISSIKIFSQDIANDLDSLLTNIKVNTASKYWQTVSEAPASISIISSNEIEAYGFKTVAEALRTVKGLYISDDKNYTYLGVRGFSRPTDYLNRVLVLLNGHSTNDNIYGGAYIDRNLAIDMNTIDRIEIVRGPSSVLYGNSAMLAIINIITKNNLSPDNFSSSFQAGSYNSYQGSVSLSKEFSNGFNFFLSGMLGDKKGENLYFQEFDSDTTNHGIAENLDWEKNHGFLLSASYGDISMNSYYTHRDKGLPTASYGINFNDSRAHTIDEQGFLELKYDKQLSPSQNLMVRGYYDNFFYNGFWPYDVLQVDKTIGKTLGLEVKFLWDILENYRLTLGTEIKNNIKAHYFYSSDDIVLYSDNYPFKNYGFYLQNEYQINTNVALTLGLRLDKFSNIGTVLTPRVAVLLFPFKTSTLKLLYGEAYRAPNIYELNINDPYGGYLGNLSLVSEKIQTVEMIWEEKLSKFIFGSVSMYQYLMNNLIDLKTMPDISLTQFENSGKVNAKGIEAELTAKFMNGLNTFINYSFQSAKDKYSDKIISNSPQHLIKLGVIYPLAENVSIASDLLYESSRKTVYDTETKPYFLINTNLTVKKVFNHFNLHFKINNLLNTGYKLPGGLEHLQESIIQTYRNYYIKIDFTL
jgi:outer membrane receptor for ferrienterochelin and colicins